MEIVVFCGVMALGQFSPGPDMVLLTRTALAEGGRRGVLMALGIASGLMVHASLALTGSVLAFGMRHELGLALRMAACAYLLWLAFNIWRTAGGGLMVDTANAMQQNPYLRGLLCNLFNPKVALFLAVVVAPFLQGGRPAWWFWTLGAVIVVEGALLWTLWALLLQHPISLRFYRRFANLMDRSFAVVLAVLAFWLLFVSP